MSERVLINLASEKTFPSQLILRLRTTRIAPGCDAGLVVVVPDAVLLPSRLPLLLPDRLTAFVHTHLFSRIIRVKKVIDHDFSQINQQIFYQAHVPSCVYEFGQLEIRRQGAV